MAMLLSRVAVVAVALNLAQVAISQKAPESSAETRQHIKDVVAGLTPSIVVKGDANAEHTLSDRMATWHVPGVSIAVIHHGVD